MIKLQKQIEFLRLEIEHVRRTVRSYGKRLTAGQQAMVTIHEDRIKSFEAVVASLEQLERIT